MSLSTQYWPIMMTSSSYYITSGYSTLFGDSLEIAGMYEDHPPLSKAISYLCQESDPYSPYQEDIFHGSISSPYEKDDVYPLVDSYQQDQLPYNSWRNWDGEYESCFAFSDYMDDNSFSYENTTGNYYGHDNGLQMTEDWFQHRDNIVSQYDNAECQLLFSDDCLWSGYDSCFGYVREDDDSCYYSRQNPSNYSMDELGFCVGIFGYWPCLSQKNIMTYSE